MHPLFSHITDLVSGRFLSELYVLISGLLYVRDM